MDNKHNFKKLLCYNIVNGCKCVYKNKCMFAHTIEEQIKEPIRQYIHNMLYEWDDLSEINLNEDKNLLDELILLTKECKNCMGKKCPGGHNCKFGVCLRENKICYNDMMYGKCYNMLMEVNNNGILLCKCIHGIHLSEKKLIPYNQRMLSDLTNIETNFLIKHNVSFNSKNNIISLCLNDNTIYMVKDIISNKLNKEDIINNLKLQNNLFVDKNISISNNNSFEDDIFDDIINNINSDTENFENFQNSEQEKYLKMDKEIDKEMDKETNNKLILNFATNDIIDKIVIYNDEKITINKNNNMSECK